jgi:uncharacterized membrane protein YadS
MRLKDKMTIVIGSAQLSVSSSWRITTGMFTVDLITEFRALRMGDVRPLALGVACTFIIALVGLIFAALGES